MTLRLLNNDQFLTRKVLLMVLLFAGVGMLRLNGQGWEHAYGSKAREDAGQAIIQTIDLGYLSVGSSDSYSQDNDTDVFVVKADVDGTTVWTQVYDEAFLERAYDVIQAPDGGFIIVGDYQEEPRSSKDLYVLKISSAGKFIWSKKFDFGEDETGFSITRGVNSGYLIGGESRAIESGDSDFLILKVDENGNEEWFRKFGQVGKDDKINAITQSGAGYAFIGATERKDGFDNEIAVRGLNAQGLEVWESDIKSAENEEGYHIISTSDRSLVITGKIGDNSDAFVAKYTPSGEQLWLTTISEPTDQKLSEGGTAVAELENGDLTMVGFAEISGGINIDIFLAGLSQDGEELWINNVGDVLNTDAGQDIAATHDGGYIITGSSANLLSFINDLSLVKTDGAGNTITSYIKGSIFGEFCNNFQPTGELPKEGWLVEAIGEDNSYFATTDENGIFTIRVDTGEYTVKVLPITNYWKTCVPGGYVVDVTQFYDTIGLEFPVAPEINCPYLEVDVSTPFLSACSEVVYTVSYCNIGTALAEDAHVEIELDEELVFESSEIPFSSKVNETYLFELGDLSVSDCNSFTITTSLACDGIAQNQAAFVTAHIFPDTICTEPDPNWDQSSIIVGGECLGQDSVQFFIKNVGQGKMTTSTTSVVIQDNLIFWQSPIQLGSQEAIVTPAFPTENGFTHRIIAEQSPGHPGRSFPTLAIEGCNEDGVIQTGFVTQFPEDDLDPFIAIDVQEIIDNSSIGDAVRMRGYPKGYGETALISPTTDLKYTIIYSNTSLDTVTRLVIRDTLPVGLDITNIQPGPSSHPYRFEVYEEGILKFTFDHISLPPNSSTNPTSTGYVTYTVPQMPGNPPGTTIEHRAAVFFETQAPYLTNTVNHTIGGANLDFVEKDLSVSIDERLVEDVKVTVQPNPFKSYTTFQIDAVENFTEFDFVLRDYAGRLVQTAKFKSKRYQFNGTALSAGLYIYQIRSKEKLLSSGKIIVE